MTVVIEKLRLLNFCICLIPFSGIVWLGVRGLEDENHNPEIKQSAEPPRGEFDSIRYLHQLLDEDLSGYVDVQESKEFLNDELNVKGKSGERLKKFHQDDPQVTVDELWISWSISEVHNWTVDQVAEWLIHHVELPQYADVFRRLSVSGTQLPRMASNSPEYLTATLGIRDPIHKRKLSLKATDAVLFGSPKRDPFGMYKHWIILASVGIASCGVWFAYSQRRKYERQMMQVSADLENFQQLERELSSLQEKVGKSDTGSLDESMDPAKNPQSSQDGNRLQEVEEELSVLRDALQRAELRAEARAWNVPVELELHLRKTYNVELSYFRSKRAAAEKQLQAAKEECEKLHKTQQGLFGPFRVAHGSRLDMVDDGLVVAKAALTELAADMAERSNRWARVEILTGLNIISFNPNADNAYLRRPNLPASPSTEHFGTTHASTSSSGMASGSRDEYDRYGSRMSWDTDNFSVNSFDSMPVNYPEARRAHVEEQRVSTSEGPVKPRKFRANGSESPKPSATRRAISSDEEERATRKVPDARGDTASIAGSDISGPISIERKKLGLKNLFRK